VRIHLFSVEEANRLLAEIRPAVEALVRARAEFDRTQGRVDVLRLATAGASPDNPDLGELERLDQRARALTDEISSGVTAIHRRGALVKDLERGLVDFYALSGDRLVFLCWQLGEPEVGHWHPLEGGFAGRLPLSASERD
jgi:hypothetical protein